MTEDAQVLADIKEPTNIDELKKAIESTITCKDGAPGYKPFYGDLVGDKGHRELIGPPYLAFSVGFSADDEARACALLWKDFLEYREMLGEDVTLFWRKHLEISDLDYDCFHQPFKKMHLIDCKKIYMRYVIVNNADIPT